MRSVWSRDEAVAFYQKNNEPFKVELVEAIPADQTVTFYQQGDFIDLCRGPHAPSTGKIGHAFKLMKVAGAYWRGDSNRPMLQRIYGTAWTSEKDLNAYLTMLEEAEKRDHRKLGKQLGLFHLQVSNADGRRNPYSTKVSFRDRSPRYMPPICGTVTWDSSITNNASGGR